jgi:uncharacterized protein (DUF697 family)
LKFEEELMADEKVNTGTEAGIDPENEYKKTLVNYSIVASAIGFIPFIPVADYWILAPLQVGMIAKISSTFGFKIDGKEFLKMIAATLGIGFILKSAAGVINRFIPFLGWFVNAGVAFAGTYAIGILTRHYIAAEGNLSEEKIKEIWAKSYAEGKEEFFRLKDFILEKKDELVKEFKEYMKEKEESDTRDEEKTEDTTFASSEFEEKDNFQEEKKKRPSRKKKKAGSAEEKIN